MALIGGKGLKDASPQEPKPSYSLVARSPTMLRPGKGAGVKISVWTTMKPRTGLPLVRHENATAGVPAAQQRSGRNWPCGSSSGGSAHVLQKGVPETAAEPVQNAYVQDTFCGDDVGQRKA